MQVTISRLAERDLESIGDYIAEDNLPRAVSFVAEFRAHLARCDGYSGPIHCLSILNIDAQAI